MFVRVEDESTPLEKRRCKGNTSATIDDNTCSPIAPSPEPLSPVLEKRECESTTYRLV